MDVFDEATIEFFHSGCSLLVGTVDTTGKPHAGRGSGLTVLDPQSGRVRLLVNLDDAPTVANLQPGAHVAITTASVRTLYSVQMKGQVVCVETATETDEAKRDQYTTDFTNDIHEIDGDELEMLHRWTACRIVACVVDVDSLFDQTPGPSAGTPMGWARS
jgi:hypothetical protein